MAALCKITKNLKISTSISRETKINPRLINSSIVEWLRYVKLQKILKYLRQYLAKLKSIHL